jgi:hypothetical protein
MPRMRPPECGNIYLLAVSDADDGKNVVCQRHNVVAGRVAASDAAEVSEQHCCYGSGSSKYGASATPKLLARSPASSQILREAETRRQGRGAGDELVFEGRGVPAGVKVFLSSDGRFSFIGKFA